MLRYAGAQVPTPKRSTTAPVRLGERSEHSGHVRREQVPITKSKSSKNFGGGLLKGLKRVMSLREM